MQANVVVVVLIYWYILIYIYIYHISSYIYIGSIMLCFSGCGFYSESELMNCYVWDRPGISVIDLESKWIKHGVSTCFNKVFKDGFTGDQQTSPRFRRSKAGYLGNEVVELRSGWWLTYPFWKIWKPVGMMTFPIYGKIKKCSKPPIRYWYMVHRNRWFT